MSRINAVRMKSLSVRFRNLSVERPMILNRTSALLSSTQELQDVDDHVHLGTQIYQSGLGLTANGIHSCTRVRCFEVRDFCKYAIQAKHHFWCKRGTSILETVRSVKSRISCQQECAPINRLSHHGILVHVSIWA